MIAMILCVCYICVFVVFIAVPSEPKQKPKPKLTPDYRKINAIERELGMRQTNYSEFGVAPVDVAEEMIRYNKALIQSFEEELLSPEEKAIKAIDYDPPTRYWIGPIV